MKKRRFGAFFVDLAVSMLIWRIVIQTINMNLYNYDYLHDMSIENYILTIILSFTLFIVTIVYFGVIPYFNNGQTIGKKLLRIRTVKNGERTSILVNIGRSPLVLGGLIAAVTIAIDNTVLYFGTDRIVIDALVSTGIGVIVLYLIWLLAQLIVIIATGSNNKSISDLIFKTEHEYREEKIETHDNRRGLAVIWTGIGLNATKWLFPLVFAIFILLFTENITSYDRDVIKDFGAFSILVLVSLIIYRRELKDGLKKLVVPKNLIFLGVGCLLISFLSIGLLNFDFYRDVTINDYDRYYYIGGNYPSYMGYYTLNVLLFIVLILLKPIGEEILLRKSIFKIFDSDKFAFLVSVIISTSFSMGISHIVYDSYVFGPYVLSTAFILTSIYVLTNKSTYITIIIHIVNNVILFVFIMNYMNTTLIY